MADLLVRSIPDDLYERYTRLACNHHRSLQDETIHLIEQAVAYEEQLEQRKAAFERINERRRQRPRATLDAVVLLRDDRDHQ